MRPLYGSLGAVIAAVALTASAAGQHHAGPPHGDTPSPTAGPTSVRIDVARAHQVMDGFGANMRAAVLDDRDLLTPPLRAKALDALFRQVRLNTGVLDGQLLESPGGWAGRRNDNDDPAVIDWNGFDTRAADAARRLILDQPEASDFVDFQIGQKINTRWASPWLAELRHHDYGRYLDEAAEQVAAACVYWRDKAGRLPRLLQLFNEPLSGNGELGGGSTKELVDLVVRAGERLTREGCGNVRFLVPSEETEEKSYESAAAILADGRARRYVGAIGYHPYPYGSPYADVPRILATAGAGRPDEGRIAQRRRLRDLARRYNLPLWMTEVSHGGVDPRSFDAFRGRAIHIHDELEYADAAAYFGMNSIWDSASNHEHFGSTDSFFSNEGDVLLVETEPERVHITGIGRAMGHYARWIRHGAVRVDATASDRLLLVSAFRDDERRRLVIVLINNAASGRPAVIEVAGAQLEGAVSGEQSTSSAYWSALELSPAATGALTLQVPALSVTTVAVNFRPL